MAVQNIPRRAGPFIGNGSATNFPFGFRIFDETDVTVVRAATDAFVEETLKLNTDYSVAVNEDRSGGSVTLTAPLAVGMQLSIISSVEATQDTTLTNHDGLLPETLNDVHDKAIILIQQLEELIGRAIKVPPTSTETEAQFRERLFNARKVAEDKAGEASGYANAANKSAEAASGFAEAAQRHLENTALEGDEQVKRVGQKGQAEIERVGATGTAQVGRVEEVGSQWRNTLVEQGNAEMTRSKEQADLATRRAKEALLSERKADAAAGAAVNAGEIAQKMCGETKEARDQAQGVSLPLMAQMVRMSDELHRCITDLAQISLARGQIFEARNDADVSRRNAEQAEKSAIEHAKKAHAYGLLSDTRAKNAEDAQLAATTQAEASEASAAEALESKVAAQRSADDSRESADVAHGISVPLMAQVVSLADDIHAVDSHEQQTSLRVAKIEEKLK